MVLKKNNRIVLKNGSFFTNIVCIEKCGHMKGFLILHNLNDEIIDVVINQNELLSDFSYWFIYCIISSFSRHFRIPNKH